MPLFTQFIYSLFILNYPGKKKALKFEPIVIKPLFLQALNYNITFYLAKLYSWVSPDWPDIHSKTHTTDQGKRNGRRRIYAGLAAGDPSGSDGRQGSAEFNSNHCNVPSHQWDFQRVEACQSRTHACRSDGKGTMLYREVTQPHLAHIADVQRWEPRRYFGLYDRIGRIGHSKVPEQHCSMPARRRDFF